jgi:hypothetical protein
MLEKTTWRPLARPYDENDNGKLDRRERRLLPDSAFALPVERELPLVDAEHVQVAVMELPALRGVTDEQRERAVANILAAAAYFGVDVSVTAYTARRSPRRSGARRR